MKSCPRINWKVFFTTVILGLSIVFPLEIAYAAFSVSSVNFGNSITSGYWINPSPTSTPSLTPSPTTNNLPPTTTYTPTPTLTPTNTPTPSNTPTPTLTPTLTSTPTPSLTITPTQSPGKIVINEIYEGGSASSTEWVELYNSGSTPVDVSGWGIVDGSGSGNTDTLPEISPIPPGGYGVIVASGSTAVPDTAIKIYLGNATIGSGLNVNGDSLHLYDAAGSLIDEMSYGTDKSVFPVDPPAKQASGKTLGRLPNGEDHDLASDWNNTLTPSMGGVNSL